MHNEKDTCLQVPHQAEWVFWAITEHKEGNKKKVKNKMQAVETFRYRLNSKVKDLFGGQQISQGWKLN